MEWFRQVHFVAAVAMPPDRDRVGTTVNGMWADPLRYTADEVAARHENGERILFSVPMIALVPREYESDETSHLLDEVCADVAGAPSECDWYYWESKPVYAACIYSDVFRRHLMELCREGVRRGMDVVNLDEIMTSIGLIDRDPGGTGFCDRCLERFRAAHAEVSALRDDELRRSLRTDDELYARYRRFHEDEAFRVMVGFIDELRSFAAERDPDFAISANLAYLGSNVERFGVLWGCCWGPHVDFVLMENDYRIDRGDPHLLLPRGSFSAWYRLGSSFTGAPTWICPSIAVPRQLAGQQRTTYYLLMFLEAYANGGRWGYHWWPGVDAETRLSATVPAGLETYARFIRENRELFERPIASNELAVLYPDGPISRRPETHVRYLALVQALTERNVQFDVVYGGDGRFTSEELDPGELVRYRTIAVPEARGMGAIPCAALELFARSGGELVTFSDSELDPRLVRRGDGDRLERFWRKHGDADGGRIVDEVAAPSTAVIEASDPAVRVIRSMEDGRQVLHLLNHRYDERTDSVEPIADITVRFPWRHAGATCTLLAPGVEEPLGARVGDGTLTVEVPILQEYALLTAEHRAVP
ncbi:MAG TPA: hypothetical protein VJ979_06125 [Actinomycetota bacterium]|nr:hypothetical protein [Actinomycetota bacterium]